MKEFNKSFISWILSRIIIWLVVWIVPALIKIVNQSWTCLHWNIPFKYIWSPSFMELPSHPDMDLILCSKRLIVVSLLFFSMVFLSSSNQIWKQMYWHHQWCSFYHPYSCSEVHLWSSKQMVSQSVLMVCIFSTFIYIQSCVHIDR